MLFSIETISILEDSGFKPYQYDPSNKELLELNKKNTQKRDTLFIRDIESQFSRYRKAPAGTTVLTQDFYVLEI